MKHVPGSSRHLHSSEGGLSHSAWTLFQAYFVNLFWNHSWNRMSLIITSHGMFDSV